MSDAPLLNHLYTVGSLHNLDGGFRFEVKNRVFDARLVAIDRLSIDGEAITLDRVTLAFDDQRLPAAALGEGVPFPLRAVVAVEIADAALDDGDHELTVRFRSEPFGELELTVRDTVATPADPRDGIPRDRDDDYTPAIIAARQEYLRRHTGVSLEHVSRYSFDPHITQGNVESFIGVAQVPIGLAGPLHIRGEHAQGEFLIPLATSEGTLVASYNRGMKVVNESGGAVCTVVEDCMQRAPVFIFEDARGARERVQLGWSYARTGSRTSSPPPMIARISSLARSNSSSESTGVPSKGRSRWISHHDRQPMYSSLTLTVTGRGMR